MRRHAFWSEGRRQLPLSFYPRLPAPCDIMRVFSRFDAFLCGVERPGRLMKPGSAPVPASGARVMQQDATRTFSRRRKVLLKQTPRLVLADGRRLRVVHLHRERRDPVFVRVRSIINPFSRPIPKYSVVAHANECSTQMSPY
jgi:hypothetical protein